MAVIELAGLRKEYKRFRRPPVLALDVLDLEVPEGGVFGFLGPNGSGKTTTIRCLLGLATPTSGRCRVLGADSQARLHSVIGQVEHSSRRPACSPTCPPARTSPC